MNKVILNKNLNVLAVIPARSGSKRVPNKNIRILHNKPLVAYIIETAQKSKRIDKLILSTDNDDIANIGASLGVDIPFKRPQHLSTDNASLLLVMRHAYNYFKERKVQYDAVLSLQPSCPFITSQAIDRVIELWYQTGCDSVVTIAQITQGHPYIAKGLEEANIIKDFCNIPKNAVVAPSQKREKAYYLTGGIYLRDKHLLELDKFDRYCLGTNSRAVVVSEIEAVDINTEIHFKFAEFLQREGMVG